VKKLSAWDRFVLAVAPQAGVRRLQARAVADIMTRSYEAAQGGRRTTGWNRNKGDVNNVIRLAGDELRIHARDLVRNNGYARRAQRVIANNVSGWGIVPKPNGPSAELNAKLSAEWKAWADSPECETQGLHTFAGLQHMAMKAIFTDGEILFRRRFRRPEDGLSIPIQIQVLEADYLDRSKDYERGQEGGPIIQGVEFDAIGRRVAYWLFEQHPGNNRTTNNGVSKRVPASNVRHVFYSERPGQVRGVSWLAAAIVNLKELDEYEDAELMRQKIAACFAAFVTDTEGAGAPLGGLGGTNDDGNEIETFEPGMIAHLPPGRQITVASPPSVTNDSFTTRNLRKIAAGLGITYEDLTGDYSQVNYSSARMGRIAHQANVRDWQANMIVPHLCGGVWAWVLEVLEIRDGVEPVGADWTVPPLPMLEPDKEGLAYSRLVRNGVLTHSDMIREQGGDPDAHFAEYAADLKRLDDLGIKLDSDVRAVSQAGLTQARAGVAPSSDPKSEDPGDQTQP
jgi:lambda family phage portal protein